MWNGANDNSFDVIICSNSFHHYPNPQRFFDSAKRVLRPEGRLILQDYTAPHFASLFFRFARHGRGLTGESPEYAQIVGSV